MKLFKFQQFNINQDDAVFRVGTDAVLLGSLANPEDAKSALEVGSGTGIVSLMLAQRFFGLNILAIDINESAVDLTNQNFIESPFSARLKVSQSDFKSFESEEKFDFIFSNPPYFEANDSSKDVVARQKVELDFQDLIQNANRLLTEQGRFSVIIPSQDEIVFVALCKKENLHLQRKVSIKGIEGGEVRRVILDFTKIKPKHLVLEEFVIEKSPRQYSDQYLETTKDFHLFKS
ncbi:methyltransferase [Soonwooa sp.]|uniref:tRNA1(Val) (adenine(37)-N6)-methyltransferase n=1 Tax=Soonwooa sp. TaxID=1938592 RepID=UPI002606B038|nr:methyltransferase [Soonwooa sp.]